MGYQIVGPTSFYRLTMWEIRMLQRGYATLNRVDESKEKAPRGSDFKKLARFKEKFGLN